ncbi:MAG TPA: PepSY-associated TM helix domain-containing protein [Solimonas sp.]|nr:PepSY-associated TM helix domain-containing protein [Solimonas sp.]
MISLPQRETRSLLAIHGWSAVFLGLLLYTVIVTGVASVFGDEIGDWANPIEQPSAQRFPAGLGNALQQFADSVAPELRESFFAFPRSGGRIYAQFHRDEKDANGRPTERGVVVDIDPRTLQMSNRREGDEDAMNDDDTVNALPDFFVNLHVRLHVPEPWGLMLTGVLGLAMLVAAVSGFLLHRHLIRELFTLRRRKKLLSARDAHVVAGSWNLVFSFVLAFTGSFFSFATSFGVPVLAMVAFNGDQQAAFETFVGNPPVNDPRPAPMANLDAMIVDATRRAHAETFFVSVEHWGRADARATISMLPAEGEVFGTTYVYDGPSGAYQYEKPPLGRVPSFGGNLFSLMAPLHFGNFAGVLSKAAWFALGFAAAYVALSGMRLWTQRRIDQPAWRPLAQAVNGIGYGLPLALIVASATYFVARALDADLQPAMMRMFLITLGACLLASWLVRDTARVAQTLLILTGAMLLGLPALRLLCGGPTWAPMFATAQFAVPALDTVLVIGGLACLAGAYRTATRMRRAPQTLALERVTE